MKDAQIDYSDIPPLDKSLVGCQTNLRQVSYKVLADKGRSSRTVFAVAPPPAL